MNSHSRSISGPFERWLYASMAGLALGVVLSGFAKTYYLKSFFESPPLPLLLHLHGAIMSIWFVLFVTQAALIRAHRVDLHRKVGIAGAAFAMILIPVALATARQFVINNLNDPDLPLAAAIAGFDAVVLVEFGILVAAALGWRDRPDIHKRLMTLAALSLLGPPLARLVGDENAVLVSNAIVILPVVVDTVWHRRLHPAFGWGGGLIVLSTHATLFLVMTPAWTNFAVRLVK